MYSSAPYISAFFKNKIQFAAVVSCASRNRNFLSPFLSLGPSDIRTRIRSKHIVTKGKDAPRNSLGENRTVVFVYSVIITVIINYCVRVRVFFCNVCFK